MAEATRVSPKTVRKRMLEGHNTLLVCAYDDDEKCRANALDGSIPLSELQSREPIKDATLVFY